MGWNDRDDRLMLIADILEGYGMEYPKSYEMAVELREDELRYGEFFSEDALMQMAMMDELGE